MEGESHCRMEQKIGNSVSRHCLISKAKKRQTPDIDLAVAGGPGVLG